MPSPKAIRELLPDLRRERGWSRERLSHEAFDIDRESTSAAQITAIERGDRRASARTMVALAKALKIAPTEFAEYRLAIARHVLDEEKVGLDKAIRNLEAADMEPVKITVDEIKEHSHQRRQAVGRAQAKAAGSSRRAQPKRRNP